jgi:uncharacterized protein YyaL (SSP411 family)
MVAALAKAGRAFNDEQYTDTAQKAAEFILKNMKNQKGELFHRYRKGEVGIKGYLDDYAFLIWGLIELYETTFDVSYLQTALELNRITLEKFWDEKNHGFFFTADDAEKLLVRKKEVYDGAIPSGNSVMMMNLIRLARMTGGTEFENKANLIARTFSSQITRNPSVYAMLLSAFDFAIGPSFEVVIVGDLSAGNTKKMLSMVNQKFIPNKVVLFLDTNQEKTEISNIAKFAEGFRSIDDRPTAYVCSNFQCELPTTDVAEMLRLLKVE